MHSLYNKIEVAVVQTDLWCLEANGFWESSCVFQWVSVPSPCWGVYTKRIFMLILEELEQALGSWLDSQPQVNSPNNCAIPSASHLLHLPQSPDHLFPLISPIFWLRLFSRTGFLSPQLATHCRALPWSDDLRQANTVGNYRNTIFHQTGRKPCHIGVWAMGLLCAVAFHEREECLTSKSLQIAWNTGDKPTISYSSTVFQQCSGLLYCKLFQLQAFLSPLHPYWKSMSCSCISERPMGAHFNNNADQKNQMEKLVMRLTIVHCLLQVALEPRPPPVHSLCIPTMHIQVISCRATLAGGTSTYFSHHTIQCKPTF